MVEVSAGAAPERMSKADATDWLQKQPAQALR